MCFFAHPFKHMRASSEITMCRAKLEILDDCVINNRNLQDATVADNDVTSKPAATEYHLQYNCIWNHFRIEHLRFTNSSINKSLHCLILI